MFCLAQQLDSTGNALHLCMCLQLSPDAETIKWSFWKIIWNCMPPSEMGLDNFQKTPFDCLSIR